MFSSQKHVFWQALLVAFFIFGIGVLLGFALEGWRVDKIASLYSQSELELFDMRILSDLSGLDILNCSLLVQRNAKFADKIYEESKLLDEYEGSSRLSESIRLQHKRYDLLRALLWVSVIKDRQTCASEFNTLVYLYQYNSPSIETKAKQAVFSKYLGEIKNEFGDKVILIPLAGDNNLESLNVILDNYNIKTLPVIILNEAQQFKEIEDLSDIKTELNRSKYR